MIGGCPLHRAPLTGFLNSEGGYVFFNNSKMTEDALKYCKLLDHLNE